MRRFSFSFYLSWATIGLALGTLLGQLAGSYFFLFELLSHFSVQYAVLGLGLAVAWLWQRQWLWATLAAACLSWHIALIIPWVLAEKPVSAGQQADLRVLHANVLFTRSDLSKTIRFVQEQRADIVVLQEVTVVHIPQVWAAMRGEFPYRDTIRSKGPCHILVLSRTPIQTDSAARSLKVIHLTTSVRGHSFDLFTVHPRTPIWYPWFRERNKQLAFVAAGLTQTKGPALLTGDFNISVFSPIYRSLFAAKTPVTACRRGFGLQPTWPRFLPPAYLPIDHTFINEGFVTTRFTTLDQPGSDHKAVRVDLRFR
ncbi:endonuclease/exonuclease/phosphatase family protein [Fibrella sp. HMF5335]|uniref:Endonuclease/exonuclease/phosphatase family protein n=1 Tax=Fibrella rubiginis TaxID=2817060 RepID=A0A939GJW9_9BACT|nr:endonuclease/exonuclease/phosphatase family protein [Fibrella rubiginis]MBO0939178.1 endonuclease/exonuclease/phosphatase family protein [Fibrella rubiginis]